MKRIGLQVYSMGIEGAHFLLWVALFSGIASLRQADPHTALSFWRWHTQLGIFALAQLLVALYQCDFSVQYVAQNTAAHLPIMYRLAALWAGHDGSWLLWIVLIGVWATSAASYWKTQCSAAYFFALTVLQSIFLMLLLWGCNPLARVWPLPLVGQDLNPLLQDPAVMIHPPLVFLAQSSLVVPFLWAVQWSYKPSGYFARPLYPWALLSLGLLTLGLLLGSGWAYYELGWGGFWFWDPVENVGLLPWLLTIALVHALSLEKHQKKPSLWALFLSIMPFLMCIWGLFLVRSGILISIHAFATDPKRGLAFFCAATIITIFAIHVLWRTVRLQASFKTPTVHWMWYSSVYLWLLVWAVVFWGTVGPILWSLYRGPAFLGPEYFNTTLTPVLVLLLGQLAIGPHPKPVQRSRIRLLVLALGAALSVWYAAGVLFCVGLVAAWRTVWGRQPGLDRRARSIHLIFIVAILSMVWTSHFGQQQDMLVNVKEPFTFAGLSICLEGFSEHTGPNYDVLQAQLAVTSGDHRSVMRPERRYYWDSHLVTSESALMRLGLSELQVYLSEALSESEWIVRCIYKPGMLVFWSSGFYISMLCILWALFQLWEPHARPPALMEGHHIG